MKFGKSLALALAMSATAFAAQAQAPTRVTIVLSHVNMAVGEEVFLYAVPKQLGYFDKEGIQVTIQGAAGGVLAGQVMESGNAQFITTLAEGILQMREQGATPVAILSLKKNNGYALSTLPGSPIKTLADLDGKTVGFPVAGGGTVLILNESLREAGKQPNYTQVVIGAGASAAAAIESKKVDAAVLWDAAYGQLENMGLKLNYIELPVQDKLAGFTLASNDKFVRENPKTVAGFCRAAVKGLEYTLANRPAAIRLFFKEFPTTVPAGVDEATAVNQAVTVLNMWLDRALKGVPAGAKVGEFEPAKWDLAKELYTKTGALKGTVDAHKGYTTQFFEACNDFNRAEIAAQARAAR